MRVTKGLVCLGKKLQKKGHHVSPTYHSPTSKSFSCGKTPSVGPTVLLITNRQITLRH